MSTVLSEITSKNDGAAFVRADLHIHSYGSDGSYDVTDSAMTPEEIVDTSIAKGLKVISITDHHQTKNCSKAIEYSADKDLLVIPGVEITTNEGHLLIYAESIKDLEKVIGKLKLSDDGKHCDTTMANCLDGASAEDAFCIAAHVMASKGGFESVITGYGKPKKNVLLHPSLLAYECLSEEELKNYTLEDDVPERVQLSKTAVPKRAFTVGSRARIMSSDAHELSRIGKNPSQEERVTRIKIERMDYVAIRTAFLDPQARIVVEEVIPQTIPRFIGIKIDGGFLDKQIIHFNKNLNCIIGGRGSGKSTLLESLKVASGNRTNSENEKRLVDSEVWPEQITLIYEDEVGNQHELVRQKSGNVVNMSNPQDGLTSVPIESYGQGDTAQAIKDSEMEPIHLLDFIDKFIDFSNLKIRDEELKSQMEDLLEDIEKLKIKTSQLPEYKKLLKGYQAKLDKLKTEKVQELVEFEEALANEDQLRTDITTNVSQHRENLDSNLSDLSSFTIIDDIKEDKLKAGSRQFENIKKLVKKYAGVSKDATTDFAEKTQEITTSIESELGAWKSNEAILVKKIEEKKAELESKGIQADHDFIKKTVKSVSGQQATIKSLEGEANTLKAKIKERDGLASERRTGKGKIFAMRLQFANKINIILKDMIGYNVNVTFNQGLYSNEFKEILATTMNWNTTAKLKSDAIANNITPEDFIDMVRTNNSKPLINLKDGEKNKIFSARDSQNIIDAFKIDSSLLSGIEQCKYEDRPRITVSKTVKDSDGRTSVRIKEFHRLSLGQQQAIILTILLNSGKKTPLIIDQPEDDLDSEFIFNAVVTTLRKTKEARQVIIVTHNANIAVLGDAELVLPLRSTNDQAILTDVGSIDNSITKKLSCTILEGGNDAFNRRKDMYGL